MDLLFLGIIIFLFILAVFDLSVGVSNDAVNFLNSALGSKAGSFKTIITVAAAGVFLGAVMSNGMMDIARHGIFRPEHFSFFDLICIFMAVMVTDIILLDVFNTLGMPTSTTVSMVFELLGASFVVAIFKMTGDIQGLSLMDLLNTEKALSVILGIFLSVAIAFVFGTVVQFIARAVFSFEYRSRLKWKIGIFGGLAVTSIIYFMLFKGLKDLAWMTSDVKEWINAHIVILLTGSFVVTTLLMQLLHILGVNVLKVVVLTGTFALAMAFAGNDLVNFIGVPVTGFESWRDYSTNGGGDPTTFMMSSLNGQADTPLYFLVGAGVIMVVSLATSKKSRNVSKTEIGLGSQSTGDEMFGSSGIARRLVRFFLTIHNAINSHLPAGLKRWLSKRFDTSQMIVEQGASFDLIRGSVNLMLAGLLIALGTSMKLPLSTTFVTFMVAMGTSLADRAWARESAVFRITGVISVIGGWFITAGVAFIGAALIAALMHWGGVTAMIVAALAVVVFIIHSNRKFRKKKKEEEGDTMFQTIILTDNPAEIWNLLGLYLADQHRRFLGFAREMYGELTRGFETDDTRTLSKCDRSLEKEKLYLKGARRRNTLCFRKVDMEIAISKSTWFHLAANSCMSINYNLIRMTEVCKEHVENNFRPLPASYKDSFAPIRSEILDIFVRAGELADSSDIREIAILRRRCDKVKDMISDECRHIYDHLQRDSTETLSVTYVFLNLLQESQEMMSGVRKLLRAVAKLHSNASVSRLEATLPPVSRLHVTTPPAEPTLTTAL